MSRFIFRTLALALSVLLIVPAFAQQKPYKIPPANLKDQIIWGSTCEGPDGLVLGFGGQDQRSDELPRTRIKVDGQWKSIGEELRKKNPLQKYHERCQKLAHADRGVTARYRYLYFEGHEFGKLPVALNVELEKLSETCRMEGASLREDLKAAMGSQVGYEQQQLVRALPRIKEPVRIPKDAENTVAAILDSIEGQVSLEQAGELLDAEPPARFLSPLAYDAKTKFFVLTAGDHGDYLTNDLWLFDPAQKKWEQRYPASAPPPRGGHTLKANGDGTVTLSGGYNYTSSFDYLGAQYQELDDGDWTYDIAANTWKGPDKGVPPDTRVYRTGCKRRSNSAARNG